MSEIANHKLADDLTDKPIEYYAILEKCIKYGISDYLIITSHVDEINYLILGFDIEELQKTLATLMAQKSDGKSRKKKGDANDAAKFGIF